MTRNLNKLWRELSNQWRKMTIPKEILFQQFVKRDILTSYSFLGDRAYRIFNSQEEMSSSLPFLFSQLSPFFPPLSADTNVMLMDE